MNRKLPWLLLVLSLLVNAGFLFGVLQAQQQAEQMSHTATNETVQAAEQLDLNAEQEAALDAVRDALRARIERDRNDERRDARQSEVLEALVRDSYDRSGMRAILREDSDARLERWLDMGEEVHGFLQILTPEQRQRFQQLAESERGFLRALLFARNGSENSNDNGNSRD
ncbi:Spy/CpxP family protein refolding chaperone [Aquibaculum sediminis]|uniref:Spy/CpxP family protein refolding chaperone n=1 Tax=Aquibaculum sediminis TaxID=3231907 RepID=UPI003451E211